jgi:pectate lyase
MALDRLRRLVDRLWAEAGSRTAPLVADWLGHDARLDTYRLLFGRERPQVLSNFAAQQQFVRLSVGLSQLTGDDAYAARARDAAMRMFDRFTDPGGLLAWGGHVAVAFPQQQIAYEGDKLPVHELKCCYPDYAWLWSLDPQATRRLIEAFWNAHVFDWTRLDFNRHGRYLLARGALWDSPYDGTPVFFWGRGLTFVNTGSDLYYAAAMLGRLSGDAAPLAWSKRLAGRYVETRQPPLTISGYQFSQCADSWCDGPHVRGDRAEYVYGPLIPPGHRVCEGTLFRPRPVVQRCQFSLAAELGDAGDDFKQWAADELRGWLHASYRLRDNCFTPMLTDGYSLEGLAIERDGYFGPAGRVEMAFPADADFLWAYTTAFRATRDEELWPAIRTMTIANGLGDPGSLTGNGIVMASPASADRRLVHALLDLFDATGCRQYLSSAAAIGDVLQDRVAERWRDETRPPIALDAIASDLLAVLYACAALTDRRGELSVPFV